MKKKENIQLDFKALIDHRRALLEVRRKKLKKIWPSLKLSDPIDFLISEIPEKVNARKKGEKVGLPQLNFLENKKGAYVYFFEINHCDSRIDLLQKLERFRSKENVDEEGNDKRRSTAKLPASAKASNSKVLYVGSIKEYVHSRIRQHLGFGHKHTFSIQLKHWAPLTLKLRFYYVAIPEKDLTIDIEATIAATLNPLIGKIEK